MKKYSRHILKTTNRLLRIPTSGISDITLDIDNIFIPLSLERQDGNKTIYGHYDIATAGNRIIVLGDPGSGKSSLLTKILLDTCFLNYISNRRKFPIKLDLKSITPPQRKPNKGYGEWLNNYIQEEIAKYGIQGTVQCYNESLISDGVILLLDGLDEISRTNYQLMEKCINGISKVYSTAGTQNIIIATSRTQFFQHVKGQYNQHLPTTVIIKPFTRTDIFRFIQRWPFYHKDKENLGITIFSELSEQQSVGDLCTNPLILSMYVAHREKNKTSITFDTRSEFFKSIANELLHNRRISQDITDEKGKTDRLTKERIVQEIAYNHIINENSSLNSFSLDYATTIIKKIKKCDGTTATAYLYNISHNTGLISEETPNEKFRFLHLTFCEYFAANCIVQQIENGYEEIINLHKKFQRTVALKTRLSVVIPFVIGLSTDKEQKASLPLLLKTNDFQTIIYSILESKQYELPSVLEFVNSETDKFTSNLFSSLDENYFQQFNLFYVLLSDISHYKSVVAIDFHHTIITIIDRIKNNHNTVANFIKTYATKNAVGALSIADKLKIDIIETIPEIITDNSDQYPFLKIILAKFFSSTQYEYKLSCLLLEASLKSPAVAYILSSEEFTTPKPNPPYRPFRLNYIRNTLLENVINTVRNSDTKPDENFPLSCAIYSSENPHKYIQIGRIILLSGSILGSLCIALLTYLSSGTDYILTRLSPIFTGYAIFIISILLTRTFSNTKYIYINALNIPFFRNTDDLFDRIFLRGKGHIYHGIGTFFKLKPYFLLDTINNIRSTTKQ